MEHYTKNDIENRLAETISVTAEQAEEKMSDKRFKKLCAEAGALAAVTRHTEDGIADLAGRLLWVDGYTAGMRTGIHKIRSLDRDFHFLYEELYENLGKRYSH